MANHITCPFCGYRDGSEYAIQYHIEAQHTDDSPFVARHEASAAAASSDGSSKRSHESVNGSMPEDMWTRCTRPNCGEFVLLSEIDEHLELHEAVAQSQSQNEGERPPSPPLRKEQRAAEALSNKPTTVLNSRKLEKRPSSRPETPETSSDTLLTVGNVRKLEKRSVSKPESSRSGPSLMSSLFSGRSTQSRSTVRRIREPRNPGRLGKRELGPHAFERRMPEEVRRRLLTDSRPKQIQKIGRDGRLIRETICVNETTGLIPILADLCALDEDNEVAYLCHPSTKHVRKLYCDGNFCGYWSIQMVLSYVQHMDPHGPQKLPHVIQMQEIIEDAWERGICSYSKIETGGVKDTRKWIGTTEAVAFFTEIGVKTEALILGSSDEQEKEKGAAAEELIDYVEAYFMSGIDAANTHGTAHVTQLPPIYFQRLGHSTVIVGMERERDGTRNLLVFDSSWATSEPVKRLLDGRRIRASPESVLRPYRRSQSSLSKYSEFEVLVPQIGAGRVNGQGT